MIRYKHLDDSFLYDGSQIDSNWAFKELRIKGSSVITWIGGMNIDPSNLKDFEDVGLEISASSMAHFIVELFDVQPANLLVAYLRQRILVSILNEELLSRGIPSSRKGDDIYIGSSKLTVSIASASLSSMKIHFGINLTHEGTPDDVDAIGLYQLLDVNGDKVFNSSNILDFISKVANKFIDELNTIVLDISKTNLL
ncbi:MAG: DUF366 family protein [Methanobrevibacter sp.]|jgi:hypothetical protein|nr:DUF366 family protein [Methanobrevibacter sp.]